MFRDMVLDREGPEPLFAHIAAELRKRIDTGEIPPGRPIPSKKRLVQEFEVAEGTVERAIQELKREGRLITVIGKGLFVARRRQ